MRAQRLPVLIVGAGVSVLCCALHLQERGVRVRLLEANWFGSEVSGWRLLRIDRIPDALPFQPPGPFEPASRSTRLSERLFICGDHRDLASLQGAMASGRRVALGVAEALR